MFNFVYKSDNYCNPSSHSQLTEASCSHMSSAVEEENFPAWEAELQPGDRVGDAGLGGEEAGETGGGTDWSRYCTVLYWDTVDVMLQAVQCGQCGYI